MITIDHTAQKNHHRQATRDCPHQPPCPAADAPDAEAALIRSSHPEQGWSLLCNGIVTFDDTGGLLPDGHAITPHVVAVPVPA
jgi:hypothetical protein